MRIERLDTLDGLQRQQDEWAALHRRLAGVSLFNSPDWVLNWLTHFAPTQPLHALLARDANGLQAVWPLVAQRSRWRRLPLTALVACTNAHSVRSALLVDPARADAAWAALEQSLREAGGWDLLLLDGCDAGAGAASQVPPLARELPVQAWQHAWLAVHGDWPAYLASRSHDLRRNLRRTERGLAALGRLDFELIEGDAERLFGLWVQLDRASWKAEHGETVDSSECTAGYYRGLLRRLTAAGNLLSGLLWLDGVPLALVVAAQQRGVLYTLKTAMRSDLSSARLSLGTLVMARLLEAAWQRPGLRGVDFVSRQDYTDRWTGQCRSFERRGALAQTWRGHLAGWLDRAAGLRGAARASGAAPTRPDVTPVD